MREEQDLGVDIVHGWLHTEAILYLASFWVSLYERSYKKTKEFLGES